MRSQIDGTLGSQFTVDLLSAIEAAPNDIFETPLMKVIDFYWQQWQRYAIALNSMYVCFPIIITILITTSAENMFENRGFALFFGSILLLMEAFQIFIEGPSTYFS